MGPYNAKHRGQQTYERVVGSRLYRRIRATGSIEISFHTLVRAAFPPENVMVRRTIVCNPTRRRLVGRLARPKTSVRISAKKWQAFMRAP